MNREIVVSVVGANRPGLVDTLSACLLAHGANWTESRMARMADRFAGVVRVSVSEANSADLIAALEMISEPGLYVYAETAREVTPDENACHLELTFTGRDRPGIVHAVTRALADFGISIDEFETRSQGGAWGDGAMFDARAMLSAPEVVDVQALRRAVEAVSPGMLVTVHAFSRDRDD